MSFSKIGAIKLVASSIVGMGASRIAAQIIKNNVAAPTNLIEKVALLAGSWAIGGIIAERSRKYTDDAIVETVKACEKIVTGIKLDAKLGRINKGASTFEKEGLVAADFEKNASDKWVPIKKDDQKNGWVQADEGVFAFYENDQIVASYIKMPDGEWTFVKESSE